MVKSESAKARKRDYNRRYNQKHKAQISERMKHYRITVLKPRIEAEDLEAIEVPLYHTSRKCRACNGKLPLSRWFDCETCRPDLGEDLLDDHRYPLGHHSLTGFKISEMKLLEGESYQKGKT